MFDALGCPSVLVWCVDVLICRCVDCLAIPLCWCVDVLMCNASKRHCVDELIVMLMCGLYRYAVVLVR